MLARKDHQRLASIIAKLPSNGSPNKRQLVYNKRHLVWDLTDWLADDNPRFKSEIFIAACWERQEPTHPRAG